MRKAIGFETSDHDMGDVRKWVEGGRISDTLFSASLAPLYLKVNHETRGRRQILMLGDRWWCVVLVDGLLVVVEVRTYLRFCPIGAYDGYVWDDVGEKQVPASTKSLFQIT